MDTRRYEHGIEDVVTITTCVQEAWEEPALAAKLITAAGKAVGQELDELEYTGIKGKYWKAQCSRKSLHTLQLQVKLSGTS